MTLWELMTEDAKTQIKSMWDPDDIDDVIEDHGFTREVEDINEYLDEFNCFRFRDFICKTENGKIIKVYYLYEIHGTRMFGDNKELLLIVGHDEAAVINLNTLDEVTRLYHH